MMVELVVGMGSVWASSGDLCAAPLGSLPWYVLPALSFIRVLPGAHMFVRKVLVPDMPI